MENTISDKYKNVDPKYLEHIKDGEYEDKFLISKWKQVTWNGFLTGGIEKGNSKEGTAALEIAEETGFVNIKNVKALPFSSHGMFYHVVKKQNRMAHLKTRTVTYG